MKGVMKQVECDSPCNFMVKSHDEKEVIEIVKSHAQKMHKMSISDKDVREKIKEAA